MVYPKPTGRVGEVHCEKLTLPSLRKFQGFRGGLPGTKDHPNAGYTQDSQN